MKPDTFARVAAHVIVGVGTAAIVQRLFGTRAGIASALAILVAHEAFDPVVADALTELGI